MPSTMRHLRVGFRAVDSALNRQYDALRFQVGVHAPLEEQDLCWSCRRHSLMNLLILPRSLQEFSNKIFFLLWIAAATGVSMSDDFFQMPSTSSSSSALRTRMLEFNVQFNDRMIHLKVSFSEDMICLTILLTSQFILGQILHSHCLCHSLSLSLFSSHSLFISLSFHLTLFLNLSRSLAWRFPTKRNFWSTGPRELGTNRCKHNVRWQHFFLSSFYDFANL